MTSLLEGFTDGDLVRLSLRIREIIRGLDARMEQLEAGHRLFELNDHYLVLVTDAPSGEGRHQIVTINRVTRERGEPSTDLSLTDVAAILYAALPSAEAL